MAQKKPGILPGITQQRLQQVARFAFTADHRGHGLAIGEIFAAQQRAAKTRRPNTDQPEWFPEVL